jgi:DNA-binding MarR family transcriptional regulator
MQDATQRLMDDYPRIFFACHSRHVRDPHTQALVSEHQARVLDHLDDIEPTTVQTLADHMGVTTSTMSLTLDRLERKGFVQRARDERDKRRVHVRLTEAGARIKEEHDVLDAERVAALLAAMSESQREEALRGLSLLARAADDMLKQYKAGRPADPTDSGGRLPDAEGESHEKTSEE